MAQWPHPNTKILLDELPAKYQSHIMLLTIQSKEMKMKGQPKSLNGLELSASIEWPTSDDFHIISMTNPSRHISYCRQLCHSCKVHVLLAKASKFARSFDVLT